MHTNRAILIVSFTALIILFQTTSFAQETKDIQLINLENNRPVENAHVAYGVQKTISDETGMIRVSFAPGEFMFISHIGMGKMSIPPTLVEKAFSTGELSLRPGDPVSLEPVMVMGLRHEERDPLSLTDNDKLSHDAGAVLSRQPAISVIRKAGGYGFDPTLRGFKYDQLNILIDGLQGAIAACPNRMDPPVSHIALNQMEKVEIHKGPFALRYGPAFGGAVNFISQQPRFSETPEVKGRLSTGFESAGSLYSVEGEVGLSGKKISTTVNAAWSQGQDYRDGDGLKVPAGFSKGSVSLNGIFKTAPAHELRFFTARNFARDIDFATLGMDLSSDDTWMVRMDYLINTPTERIASATGSVFATFVDHEMDNLSKKIEPRMMNAATLAQTVAFGGKMETRINIGRGQAGVGADFRSDEAKGDRTREFLMGPNAGNVMMDNVWQDGRVSRVGAFVEYRLPTRPINYIVSGRVDYNRAVSDRENEQVAAHFGTMSYSGVSPSFSFGATADLSQKFSAGLWLGRSERSGGLSERYINFFPVGLDAYELVGNPNLKPEVNHEVDLNLNYETEGALIQVSFFASWLNDFISSRIDPNLQPRLPTSPGVRRFENLEKASLRGMEFMWMQKWPLSLRHRLEAAYTYGKNVAADEPLPEIPPLDLRLSLSGDYGRFTPEISLRTVFDQNRVSPSFGEMETPAFLVMNAGAAYRFSSQMKLSGGVENLFDRAYYEHLSRRIPGGDRPLYSPGRNFYLALVWSGFEGHTH